METLPTTYPAFKNRKVMGMLDRKIKKPLSTSQLFWKTIQFSLLIRRRRGEIW